MTAWSYPASINIVAALPQYDGRCYDVIITLINEPYDGIHAGDIIGVNGKVHYISHYDDNHCAVLQDSSAYGTTVTLALDSPTGPVLLSPDNMPATGSCDMSGNFFISQAIIPSTASIGPHVIYAIIPNVCADASTAECRTCTGYIPDLGGCG